MPAIKQFLAEEGITHRGINEIQMLMRRLEPETQMRYSELFEGYREGACREVSIEFNDFISRTCVPGTPLTLQEILYDCGYNAQTLFIDRARTFCVDKKLILDAGCGPGIYLAYLALSYPEAHFAGIDFSQGCVEAARRRISGRGIMNAGALNADIRELPRMYGEIFDAALLINTLDDELREGSKLEDPKPDLLLEEKLPPLAKVVKKGGKSLVMMAVASPDIIPYSEYVSDGLRNAGFPEQHQEFLSYLNRDGGEIPVLLIEAVKA